MFPWSQTLHWWPSRGQLRVQHRHGQAEVPSLTVGGQRHPCGVLGISPTRLDWEVESGVWSGWLWCLVSGFAGSVSR